MSSEVPFQKWSIPIAEVTTFRRARSRAETLCWLARTFFGDHARIRAWLSCYAFMPITNAVIAGGAVMASQTLDSHALRFVLRTYNS